MVKITLEYTKVEEAIAALGKLVGIVAQPAPTEKPGRKPRADKGQQREPYKSRAPEAAAGATPSDGAASGNVSATVPDSGKGAEQAPNPKSTPVDVLVVPGVQTGEATIAAAPIPTAEQAQKALEKLFEAKPPIGGLTQTQAALSRFGVQRLRELKPENRAPFIALVEEVLAGKPV